MPSDSSTSTPVASCTNPVTSRSRWSGTWSSPTQPARMRSNLDCNSASPYGCREGKLLMSKGVPANAATCATCPSDRNRSAIPRWSSTSIVRECRPRAREPTSSWLARRSTMATSTPASASSPANISPVGPPPANTTASPVTRTQHARHMKTGRIASQLLGSNVNGTGHGGMDVAWRQLGRQSADMQSDGRRRDFQEVSEMCVDAFDHRNMARFVFLPHPSDMTCEPPLFDEVGERTLNRPHRVPITQIFRRVDCCGKAWRRNQEANAQTWQCGLREGTDIDHPAV